MFRLIAAIMQKKPHIEFFLQGKLQEKYAGLDRPAFLRNPKSREKIAQGVGK